jgi:hypothetical protein
LTAGLPDLQCRTFWKRDRGAGQTVKAGGDHSI